MISFSITFDITSWPFYIDSGFTLRNFVFRTVKLNKNADPDKYCCCGYDISFDVRGTFSLLNGGFGKNVVILSAHVGSSVYVDNEERYLNFL